jgi:hypothetical protein
MGVSQAVHEGIQAGRRQAAGAGDLDWSGSARDGSEHQRAAPVAQGVPRGSGQRVFRQREAAGPGVRSPSYRPGGCSCPGAEEAESQIPIYGSTPGCFFRIGTNRAEAKKFGNVQDHASRREIRCQVAVRSDRRLPRPGSPVFICGEQGSSARSLLFFQKASDLSV